MPKKPRTLWLLLALSLTLLMCMTFATGSIIFTTHEDGALYRYPACRSFRVPVWQYFDTNGSALSDDHGMSQKAQATYQYVCRPPVT